MMGRPAYVLVWYPWDWITQLPQSADSTDSTMTRKRGHGKCTIGFLRPVGGITRTPSRLDEFLQA